MKRRIVFWGTNAENEKVLVALQLDPEQNIVHEWIFPQAHVTEEFANNMMRDWRIGKEIDFPESAVHSEKALTASESLLSSGLKPDKEDIILRAQTEWHFIVLSHKLKQGFENEFQELKGKTDKLLKYDNELWEELKTFWDRVQNQVREKNLFKEHAQILRDGTNSLFEQLKKLRKAVDEEFDRSSRDHVNQFQKKLDEINHKLSNNLSLQPLFSELKELQNALKGVEMNRNDRSSIWDQIDKLFKLIKDKRFGHKDAREGSGSDRLSRRYEGLLEALHKMESSIKRDYNDLEFEKRKVANSEGQLEAQIRQAKIKMIEERIRSKEEKLHDMRSTKEDLEKRQEQEKQREIRRQEKLKLEQAKHAVEDRIKDEIKKAAEARKDDARLEKAAEAISGTARPIESHDSILDAIGTTLGETLEDVVDTVRAVSEVVGEKLQDFAENLKGDKPAEDKNA